MRHIWPRGSSTKTNEDTRSRVAVYLVDVFSRRIARSTHTNNRVINELWNRVQKKRGPSQAILQQSLVCSDLIVKEILGKKKRKVHLDSGTPAGRLTNFFGDFTIFCSSILPFAFTPSTLLWVRISAPHLLMWLMRGFWRTISLTNVQFDRYRQPSKPRLGSY